jgi:hypothetical protein
MLSPINLVERICHTGTMQALFDPQFHGLSESPQRKG